MQHSEELLAIWRAKITSREALREAVERSEALGLDFDRVTAGSYISFDAHSGVPGFGLDRWALWPTSRDMVREHLGIYESPTSVLLWLREHGYLYQFPHISREDTTKVAYSADTQGATNDVKVRTTIGKLLRKLLPELSDDQVAQLSAMHTADLDPTFNVATSVEDIERIYTNMEGDSGCMRYRRDRFGHDEYHPSAVYSSPGLGVAYMGTLDSPTSRCVIYQNPDNPDDKRFVRIYGSPVLANKLKRAGYRQAGLAGVRLTRLRDPGLPSNRIVMPYIDPPGGRGSGIEDSSAQSFVAFKGEDFVTLVSPGQVERLQQLGYTCMSATSTEGHLRPSENTSRAKLQDTDLLTGEPIDVLTARAVRSIAIEKDGVFTVGVTADTDSTDHWGGLHVYEEDTGRMVYVLVSDQVYEAWAFKHNMSYAATPETVRYLGYRPLDPARYGPKMYATEDDSVEISPGVFLRRDDAMVVYNADGCITYADASREEELRGQGYVPTPNRGGVRVLSHPDNPKLKTLVSGRRAILGYHDVVETWDGQYCMRDSAFSASIFGAAYWFTEHGIDLPASFWERRAANNSMDWPYNDTHVLSMLRKPVKFDGVSSYVPSLRKSSDGRVCVNLAGIYDISSVTHSRENLLAAAEWIIANPGALASEVGSVAPYVEAWAKCALSLVKAVTEAREAARVAELVDQEDEDSPAPAVSTLSEIDALLGEAITEPKTAATTSAAPAPGVPLTMENVENALLRVFVDEAQNIDSTAYQTLQALQEASPTGRMSYSPVHWTFQVARPDDSVVAMTNAT